MLEEMSGLSALTDLVRKEILSWAESSFVQWFWNVESPKFSSKSTAADGRADPEDVSGLSEWVAVQPSVSNYA